jgi:hypothetical protein
MVNLSQPHTIPRCNYCDGTNVVKALERLKPHNVVADDELMQAEAPETSTFEEEKKDQDYNKKVFAKKEASFKFDRPEGFIPLEEGDQGYNKIKFNPGQMREDLRDAKDKAGRPAYGSPSPTRQE